MNTDIRDRIEECYLIADEIEKNGVMKDEITTTFRENVRYELLKFLSFLSSMDMEVTSKEVDFIIEDGIEIIPIEVKSGKDYKRHVALDNLLSNSEYNIKKAYTLCNGNVEVVDNRIYIPIYMIMFFEKKAVENNIINFDFSAIKRKNT